MQVSFQLFTLSGKFGASCFTNTTSIDFSPPSTSWVGLQRLVPISNTMTPASPPTVLPPHSRPTVTRLSMGSDILGGQGSRDEVMMSLWLLAGGLEMMGGGLSQGSQSHTGLSVLCSQPVGTQWGTELPLMALNSA